MATEVYAVGTPLSENLKATVTKGIISAVRIDKTSDLEFIQADVSINHQEIVEVLYLIPKEK